MKKILLGSTAIVAAGMIASVPSADAASKMKLGLGGYMEQWIGFTSGDDGVARTTVVLISYLIQKYFLKVKQNLITASQLV